MTGGPEGLQEHDDVVCQVVRGTLEAEVVLRTEDVVAFLDIHPLFLGHTLVVPRAHHETLAELPVDQLAPLFGLARRVSAVIRYGRRRASVQARALP